LPFLNRRDSWNLVFIAGGIGITPFMSMLRFISDNGTERKVTLLWGNKSEKRSSGGTWKISRGVGSSYAAHPS